MVNYKLDFSDEGKISFSSLDKAIAQRILNKLKWLTQNIEAISPLPLKWNYEGLFTLRIGDWRVLYVRRTWRAICQKGLARRNI